MKTFLLSFTKTATVLSAMLVMSSWDMSAQSPEIPGNDASLNTPVTPSVNIDNRDARFIDEDVKLSLMMQSYRINALKEVPMWYPRFQFASNSSTVDASGGATLASWDGGMVYATGAVTSLQGLAGIERGRVTFLQQLGPLSVSMWGEAAKYGYFRGLTTQYGFGGSATWTFNPTLSLTVFGSYYNTNPWQSSAMAPYFASTNYGGYLGINFNDHWGVDVGAQRSFESYNNRWATRPIVAPYYKMDNGAKIQVDVGGIVYGLLENAGVIGRQNNNPTMGPPIPMGPPPVK